MNRLKQSWMLFRCSVQVVFENKKLLLFPIIVGFFLFIIALFFLAPVALWNTGYAFTEAAHWKALADDLLDAGKGMDPVLFNTAGFVLLFVLYSASMFLATFFNVAFYNEILNALNGRPVSVSGGLRFALTRLKAITAWSLFTGVVGLLIKSLEERVGVIGRLVLKLVGIAWSVASVFVVPVIVREEKHANPIRFLKTSASLLKKTWGEALIGYVGLSFGGLIVFVASLLLLGGSLFLSFALNNFWFFSIGFLVWFAGLIAFVYVLRVAGLVYLGALYIYASEGVVPAPFEPQQMEMAWKIKSGRKPRNG
jgi:hypothetical protein